MSEKNFLLTKHNDQSRGSDENQEPSEDKSKRNVGVVILDTSLVLAGVIAIILLWVKTMTQAQMGEIGINRVLLLVVLISAFILLLVDIFAYSSDRIPFLTILSLLICTNVILIVLVGSAVVNGVRISMVEDAGYSSVESIKDRDSLSKYEGVKDGQEYIIEIEQNKNGLYYEAYPNSKPEPVETGELIRKAKRDNAS